MHYSALQGLYRLCDLFCKAGVTVVDVGGADVNGSARDYFEAKGVKYIVVDMAPGKGVDIITPPGDPLPFADGSVDMVVSTSCFEHDPCFWITFKEMARIVKIGGLIYVNAPGNGPYHCFPGDNYRFYPDAAYALAHWSVMPLGGVYPVAVQETFHVRYPLEAWADCVGLWRRTEHDCTGGAIRSPLDGSPSTGPLAAAIAATPHLILMPKYGGSV